MPRAESNMERYLGENGFYIEDVGLPEQPSYREQVQTLQDQLDAVNDYLLREDITPKERKDAEQEQSDLSRRMELHGVRQVQ